MCVICREINGPLVSAGNNSSSGCRARFKEYNKEVAAGFGVVSPASQASTSGFQVLGFLGLVSVGLVEE